MDGVCIVVKGKNDELGKGGIIPQRHPQLMAHSVLQVPEWLAQALKDWGQKVQALQGPEWLAQALKDWG